MEWIACAWKRTCLSHRKCSCSPRALLPCAVELEYPVQCSFEASVPSATKKGVREHFLPYYLRFNNGVRVGHSAVRHVILVNPMSQAYIVDLYVDVMSIAHMLPSKRFRPTPLPQRVACVKSYKRPGFRRKMRKIRNTSPLQHSPKT